MGIAINGKIPAGFSINGKKVAGIAMNGMVIWKSSNLPPVGTTLNDCTWQQISDIATAGKASDYFAVGDRKAVLVNGTVGTVALNNTYYVYILGFDHNGATNCIDFGTFKTSLTGGKDICLVDESYGVVSGTAAHFNMNTTKSNNNGWKGSKMRTTVLGSSKTLNTDAIAETALSPVANTLMSALPEDLRSVMKPMTIYTDNVGGGGSTASNVTASVDYLPLLAEFEIFGACTKANTNEKTNQAQYQYFKSGNAKKKFKHNAQSTGAIWWGRSPAISNANKFCYTSTTGTKDENHAKMPYGIAPIFRV